MSPDNSDDEDVASFIPCLRSDEIVEEVHSCRSGTHDVGVTVSESVCWIVDWFFLQKQVDSLIDVSSYFDKSSIWERRVVESCISILQGKHLDVVGSAENELSLTALLTHCQCDSGAAENIRNNVYRFIQCGVDENSRECKALFALVLGVSYLEVYCQSNYTGPELSQKALAPLETPPASIQANSINSGGVAPTVESFAIKNLESDGDYAFPTCQIPQTLLIARSILAAIADPERADWSRGIVLTSSGVIEKSRASSIVDPSVMRAINNACLSREWRSARAAVVHLRLLQKQTYDHNPTLWKECSDLFQGALGLFGERNQSLEARLSALKVSCAATLPPSIDVTYSRELAAQLWLEWGLCYHHFQFGDRGKSSFAKAREAAGLVTKLTASMGKRTKYQQTEYAQLYLLAKSSLLTEESKESAAAAAVAVAVAVVGDAAVSGVTMILTNAAAAANDSNTAVPPKVAATPSIPPCSSSDSKVNRETEESTVTGHHAGQQQQGDSGSDSSSGGTGVREGTSSGAAASADEGTVAAATEGSSGGWNHGEYEVGRRLVVEAAGGEEAAVREVLLDSTDGGPEENILFEGGPRFSDEDLNKGGSLHSIDQAVILALCLDVENNNPKDGLTNEEMFPYIQRVLQLASNWMIHSTGLLQRSWLEFEKRRTMDRAMLQIQALLDQHTTKLTVFQSTFKSIEESAPAEERLQYLHCIVYPAQYELKRDLAMRYLKSNVFASALNFFQELEMWDEVVTCYQLMQKPHRAELVVRERLKQGESPYMLTALADLTQNEDLYERAWELSNHRYARAKRTLAKMCFDRGDFKACVSHSDAALAVQPLVATSWYLRGLACMRLEDWNGSLVSFTRCVQQDLEIGEAWANMGAVYMRLRDFPKAESALLEAIKHKTGSWRILENLMMVGLALGKWRDVIRHMNALLDLRNKSQRPVHKDELRRLAYFVAMQTQREEQQRQGQNEGQRGGNNGIDTVTMARDNSNVSNEIATSYGVSDGMTSLFGKSDNRDDRNGSGSAGNDRVTVVSGRVVSSSTDAVKGESSLNAKTSLDTATTSTVPADHATALAPAVRRLPNLAQSLEQLLDKVTLTVATDPEIWDIIAQFHAALDSPAKVVDCRAKEFRALLSEPQWEKELAKVEAVSKCAIRLVDAHRVKVKIVGKTELYSCKSLLQSALRKMEGIFKEHASTDTVRALLGEVDAAYTTAVSALAAATATLTEGSGCYLAPRVAVDASDVDSFVPDASDV